MQALKDQVVEQVVTTRSILRRYMADYSAATSVTSKVKSGFFAIHLVDQDKVWLGETSSFLTTLKMLRNKSKMADCVMKARDNGERTDIWFLTQPDRFSAQQLENELWVHDRLAERKAPVQEGPGQLYSIRHDRSHDYYVLADRTETAPSKLLSSFIERLRATGTGNRNENMAKFITENANDILLGSCFTITQISRFKDSVDEQTKRRTYINENKFGKNLNTNRTA